MHEYNDTGDTSRHKLAGRFVRDEIARQGKTQRWAAAHAGMSGSTLARILTGDPTVEPMKLRSIEGALGLADQILTYVINGDIASIEAIGADELRPGQRRIILATLTPLIDPPPNGLGGPNAELA